MDSAGGSTVDRASFIDAMSAAASSVAVVTTDGPAGRFGLTVSAITSVTADPPTLLICVHRKNLLAEAISTNRVFSASLLRSDQRVLAEVFAGRARQGSPYDFSIARWETTDNGCPVLAGSVAWFGCDVSDEHRAGTHSIFLGRVIDAGSGSGLPLVYGRRSFAEIEHLPVSAGEGFDLLEPVWDEPIGADEEQLE